MIMITDDGSGQIIHPINSSANDKEDTEKEDNINLCFLRTTLKCT